MSMCPAHVDTSTPVFPYHRAENGATWADLSVRLRGRASTPVFPYHRAENGVTWADLSVGLRVRASSRRAPWRGSLCATLGTSVCPAGGSPEYMQIVVKVGTNKS